MLTLHLTVCDAVSDWFVGRLLILHHLRKVYRITVISTTKWKWELGWVIDTEFRKSPKATVSFYGLGAVSGWQWVCHPHTLKISLLLFNNLLILDSETRHRNEVRLLVVCASYNIRSGHFKISSPVYCRDCVCKLHYNIGISLLHFYGERLNTTHVYWNLLQCGSRTPSFWYETS